MDVGGGATLWLWRVANGRPTGVLVSLNRGRFLAVSPDGHYRASPGVETELVYVVQTDQGQQTLTPAEFAQKYHWKNNPDRVRPLGPDVPDSLDIESFPPPKEATPLFDDKPTHTVGETPLESKQKFGGCFRLHVEYRLPEAAATGGVEVQGRYRVLLTNTRSRLRWRCTVLGPNPALWCWSAATRACSSATSGSSS